MLEPTDKKQCDCYLYKHTVVFAAVKVCDSEPRVTPPSCRGEDCIYDRRGSGLTGRPLETQTKAIHKHLAASHSDERYCMSLCALSEQPVTSETESKLCRSKHANNIVYHHL